MNPIDFQKHLALNSDRSTYPNVETAIRAYAEHTRRNLDPRGMSEIASHAGGTQGEDREHVDTPSHGKERWGKQLQNGQRGRLERNGQTWVAGIRVARTELE